MGALLELHLPDIDARPRRAAGHRPAHAAVREPRRELGMEARRSTHVPLRTRGCPSRWSAECPRSLLSCGRPRLGRSELADPPSPPTCGIRKCEPRGTASVCVVHGSRPELAAAQLVGTGLVAACRPDGRSAEQWIDGERLWRCAPSGDGPVQHLCARPCRAVGGSRCGSAACRSASSPGQCSATQPSATPDSTTRVSAASSRVDSSLSRDSSTMPVLRTASIAVPTPHVSVRRDQSRRGG